MLPRLLLDTHVLVRWLFDSRKLSRAQRRVLESAVRRGEPVALSAITLLEIAVLASGEKPALQAPLDVASLGVLRDPADRAIAATARVHRLRLLTSDQRIIGSKLVQVVE